MSKCPAVARGRWALLELTDALHVLKYYRQYFWKDIYCFDLLFMLTPSSFRLQTQAKFPIHFNGREKKLEIRCYFEGPHAILISS